MKQTETLTVDCDGIRLDVFLTHKFPNITRNQIQKLTADGFVSINDKLARAGTKLRIGDVIRASFPAPVPCDLIAEDIPLNIVYEDEDILVIDKPPGMTTHPAHGNTSHTLVNAILSYLPNLPESDSPARPGIVHRLDKDTSGLIIIAKTAYSLAYISEQFKARQVKKTYVALVRGKLNPQQGIINAPIGRDHSHRKRMTISITGREAQTEYTTIEAFPGYSLLEINPLTGRTHQIRVHLASIGHHVIGDTTYGAKSLLVERHFLHASRIRIELPGTKTLTEFTAPLPNDLQSALKTLRSQNRE